MCVGVCVRVCVPGATCFIIAGNMENDARKSVRNLNFETR